MRRVSRHSVCFVLVAAVVVGAASAIGGLVDTVLMRPLSFPHPENLALVFSSQQSQNGILLSYREIQAINTTWPGRTGAYQVSSQPVEAGGRAVLAERYLVSPEFFGALGVAPAWGRSLAPSDTDGSAAVATAGLCQSLFSTPNCVGRTVRAMGMGGEFQIVGTLPARFRFGGQALGTAALPVQLWLASSFSTGQSSPGNHDISLLLRLPPGTGTQQVNAGLATVARAEGGQYRMYAEGLVDAWLGPVRPVLMAAMGAALALLLLAAANLSLFLLLLAGRRGREFAVRAALGARRGQLVAAALREIGVWTACACGGGLLLCWGLEIWLRTRLSAALPRAWRLELGGRTALLAVAAAALIGLIAAIGPVAIAWRAAGVSIVSKGAVEDADPRTPRGGRLLAGAQIALAIVLVGVCAAMAHTVRSLGQGALGFDAAHVVSVEFLVPIGAGGRQFLNRFRAAVLATPGVTEAAVATQPPMTGYYGGDVWLPGRAPLEFEFELAGPGYFRTLGVPVIAGRGIADSDTLAAPMVAIVNQAFVRANWGDGMALGKTLKFELPPAKWRTVVGVVGDFRDRDPASPPEPEIFIPMAQSAGFVDTVLVRGTGSPERLAALIAPRLSQLTSGAAPGQVSTSSRMLAFTTRMQAFLAEVFGAFGVFALLVGIAGLFALTSEAARRGQRALAIRSALGASRTRICRLVLRRFIGMVISAGIAGFVLTGAAVFAFQSLLFDLPPWNGWLLAAVGLVVLAAGLAGCLLPALRVTRVDPAAVLREG